MKYVDISQACNKKWIERDGQKAEGIEDAVLNESYLTCGRIEGNGFSFLPPSRGFDIIECARQYVPVKDGDGAVFVDIAGFAVFGLSADNIVLTYADGEKQPVTVKYKDLVWVNLEYSQYQFTRLDDRNPCGKTVIEFAFFRGEQKIPAVICAHRIPLKKKPLEGIQLPDNMFIHICGITLGEKNDL